jgi:hypothetical protein
MTPYNFDPDLDPFALPPGLADIDRRGKRRLKRRAKFDPHQAGLLAACAWWGAVILGGIARIVAAVCMAVAP